VDRFFEEGMGLMSGSVRRLVLAGLALACMTALAGPAQALAAAPEPPELTVESIATTTATFHGVLNPVEAAEPNNRGGTYKFLYRASNSECTGGSVTKPAGLSLGQVHEEVSEAVSGLAANTEYTVCLSVTNVEGETTLSAPVPFKTAIPPEKPATTEPAASITAVSAKFEGTLNPHSSRKVGGHFAYSNPEGSSCTEGPTAALEEFEGEKEAEAIAVHTTVALEPDRTYRFCLVATDELGDAVAGNEAIVKTLAPPPAILSESGPALVTPAPVTATVNPNNQVTECHFQYGTASVSENETPCEQGALTGLEQGVGVTVTGLQLEKLYRWRIVLKNAKGEEERGAEKQFETLFSPSAVLTGAAEGVTAASADLGGKLDAGGEAEYYVEYGTVPCAANSCGTKSTAAHVSGKIQECVLGGVLQECVAPIAVSGLEPATTYHYWLVATNGAASQPVHGQAMQFTTKPAAPLVQTGGAVNVTATSATLTGELNPGGAQTEYYVEYLLPSNATERSAAAFANGLIQVGVTPVVVSGLQPNTTYYYWLVAKSSAVSEPVRGGAQQFTTARSQAELEAQAAANRKPAEEIAAAAVAGQRLEEEARRAAEAAAAANAAKQKQYEEIAAVTAGLDLREAEAGKHTKEEKAKPKLANCRKGFSEKRNKCVRGKSKKKGKVKK
jgi:hypothetical protein